MIPVLGTSWVGGIPPSTVTLNKNHPLARGLVGFWIATGQGKIVQNLIRPASQGDLAGPTWVETPQGLGIDFDGSTTDLQIGQYPDVRPTTVPYTIISRVKPKGNANANIAVFVTNDGAAQGVYRGINLIYHGTSLFVELRQGNGGGSGSTNRRGKISANNSITLGNWYTMGATSRAVSSNDMSLYLNGLDIGGTYSGTGSAIANASNTPAAWGGQSLSGALGNMTWLWGAFWNRNLTADEHFLMHIDPFQMFEEMPIFTDMGATPVSQTYALPYEIVQAIAATASNPYEVIQAITQTGSLPYEMLQALAASGSLSYEILKAIAQTGSLPYETISALAATFQNPYEVLQGLAATGSLPYEIQSGSNAVVSSYALPYETIAALALTGSLPYETLQALATTPNLPYETLQGIQGTLGVPYEVLAGLADNYGLPLEVVGVIASSYAMPYEHLAALAEAFSLPWEVVAGIIGSVHGGDMASGTLASGGDRGGDAAASGSDRGRILVWSGDRKADI